MSKSFSNVEMLNVLVALCKENGELNKLGFKRKNIRVEQPIRLSGRNYVPADLVMFSHEINSIVCYESKSGSSFDREQAIRYKRVRIDQMNDMAPGFNDATTLDIVYVGSLSSIQSVINHLNNAGIDHSAICVDTIVSVEPDRHFDLLPQLNGIVAGGVDGSHTSFVILARNHIKNKKLGGALAGCVLMTKKDEFFRFDANSDNTTIAKYVISAIVELAVRKKTVFTTEEVTGIAYGAMWNAVIRRNDVYAKVAGILEIASQQQLRKHLSRKSEPFKESSPTTEWVFSYSGRDGNDIQTKGYQALASACDDFAESMGIEAAFQLHLPKPASKRKPRPLSTNPGLSSAEELDSTHQSKLADNRNR